MTSADVLAGMLFCIFWKKIESTGFLGLPQYVVQKLHPIIVLKVNCDSHSLGRLSVVVPVIVSCLLEGMLPWGAYCSVEIEDPKECWEWICIVILTY